MTRSRTQEISARVYYEDTDAGGVVYYANYLRFFERGRSEFLRELGLPARMALALGWHIVVRRCCVDYLAPARLDDLLTIRSQIINHGRSSLTMQQQIILDGQVITRAEVKLAIVSPEGKPMRMPDKLQRIIATAEQ